ncbi:hypothetical protein PGT21_003441 [Puccinia graminis f. sp. tritici]|uniref:Uncharacterized protein n=1 Tax=Puccinia graminis f. sp. tritici TaxID=56615 RepID=A0A5B0Q4M1_PUCGR|nr:hypothetical protein PGT21_003441 [Puccinia graminis f. sp. tritici]
MKVSVIVAAAITLVPLSSAMNTGPDNTRTTCVASGSATTDSVLGSASAGDWSADSGVYRTVTVHDLTWVNR